MAILTTLFSMDLGTAGLLMAVLLCAYFFVPYFTTFAALRKVPGPLISKFSNVWIGLHSRAGNRFHHVNKVHQKYGKVVRLGPDHVSIASEDALPLVYGHGNGFLKS